LRYVQQVIIIKTLNRYISLNETSYDEENYCMNPDSPCETMEHALDLKIEDVHSAVVMIDEYKKEMNETLTFGEKDKITLKGFDEKQRKPVLTISKPLAEVSGLFNCSSFTLTLKQSTSFDYLFIIKHQTTSLGKVILNNIILKCKIFIKKFVGFIILL